MGTPKGMSCRPLILRNKDQIMLYSDPSHLVLQLRHQTLTENNILAPSFKVAVELAPDEALTLAQELLSIATPIVRHIYIEATSNLEKEDTSISS